LTGYNGRAVNDPDPATSALCPRCERLCDLDDNFCRRCGLALSEQRLPSVRKASLPARWQPQFRGVVVRGAAYLAAGAIARRLLRAVASRALGRARPQPPARVAKGEVVSANGGTADAQLVSETFLLRRVRIRR
jgi:hypothetical protein